ncbi:hypothetical protein VIC_001400 [Vibrio coralliilyticus ATCC BAA-450]|nr:hypothetical protein VIC_001400 [Vibrio coralliilyticus ATCC BAA-450]
MQYDLYVDRGSKVFEKNKYLTRRSRRIHNVWRFQFQSG